jgi:Fe-S cluster assembly protein SufD
MTDRKVIRRTSNSRLVRDSEQFSFTKEMVPALNTNGSVPDFVKNYSRTAWEAYENLPMPTTKDEPWRRTDIRGMKVGSFVIPRISDGDLLPGPPEGVLNPIAGDEHGGQIVLTAGYPDVQMDQQLVDKGVIFTDYLTAQREYPEILAKILGKIVDPGEGKLSALAAAMAVNGVFLYIPKNLVLEHPLHSILWGAGSQIAYFSHLLIFLDEGSSATYVHESASQSEEGGQTLHSGIVEILVSQDANLRFVELQSWGTHVWNFTRERARVERNGTLDWIFGSIGSHLTKNFTDLDLVGSGASGRMSGFYFTNGDQHLDHDTQQNHLAPNTTSDLLFKGALKDNSRSVWQGMIYVAPGAQKTDGYQANRNLVLSPKARADSIPGLEILADDVRCTHGATVGKIDSDMVFYLRSRGIPYEEAERLIVEGFFDPIMQRIPFEGVRSRFQNAITEKMG